MRVKLVKPIDDKCPPEERTEGAHIFKNVSLGAEFIVLGVQCMKRDIQNRAEYLVRAPSSNYHFWVPAWFFEISDGTIPSDWIVNSWPQYSTPFILGPAYFTKSVEDFDDFMSSEPEQREAYHNHLKSLDLYITPASEDENLMKLQKQWGKERKF